MLAHSRGFGSGSGMGSAAVMKPKAGLGFKASAAFTVLKLIGYENVITNDQPKWSLLTIHQ